MNRILNPAKKDGISVSFYKLSSVLINTSVYDYNNFCLSRMFSNIDFIRNMFAESELIKGQKPYNDLLSIKDTGFSPSLHFRQDDFVEADLKLSNPKFENKKKWVPVDIYLSSTRKGSAIFINIYGKGVGVDSSFQICKELSLLDEEKAPLMIFDGLKDLENYNKYKVENSRPISTSECPPFVSKYLSRDDKLITLTSVMGSAFKVCEEIGRDNKDILREATGQTLSGVLPFSILAAHAVSETKLTGQRVTDAEKGALELAKADAENIRRAINASKPYNALQLRVMSYFALSKHEVPTDFQVAFMKEMSEANISGNDAALRSLMKQREGFAVEIAIAGGLKEVVKEDSSKNVAPIDVAPVNLAIKKRRMDDILGDMEGVEINKARAVI